MKFAISRNPYDTIRRKWNLVFPGIRMRCSGGIEIRCFQEPVWDDQEEVKFDIPVTRMTRSEGSEIRYFQDPIWDDQEEVTFDVTRNAYMRRLEGSEIRHFQEPVWYDQEEVKFDIPGTRMRRSEGSEIFDVAKKEIVSHLTTVYRHILGP